MQAGGGRRKNKEIILLAVIGPMKWRRGGWSSNDEVPRLTSFRRADALRRRLTVVESVFRS